MAAAKEPEIVSEAEPSVSPTPWPTERALRESVPGRHPEQDPTLPDIQTHLQPIVAVTRSEPDPHFKAALLALFLNSLSFHATFSFNCSLSTFFFF